MKQVCFWPIRIPFSMLLVERSGKTKWLLRGMTLLGALIGLGLMGPIGDRSQLVLDSRLVRTRRTCIARSPAARRARYDEGRAQQSNCSITVTLPKRIEPAAFSKDLLASLPPRSSTSR